MSVSDRAHRMESNKQLQIHRSLMKQIAIDVCIDAAKHIDKVFEKHFRIAERETLVQELEEMERQVQSLKKRKRKLKEELKEQCEYLQESERKVERELKRQREDEDWEMMETQPMEDDFY